MTKKEVKERVKRSQVIAELVISFEGLEGKTRRNLKISGDNYGEDPPVSMPNTVVKLPDADDSALEAARENMSLPGLEKTDAVCGARFLFILRLLMRLVGWI